ncbi:MAG: ABC transporter ATP-binding protein [Clostridium sp.]|uniref:ABC transporter ATP-binding protein n=1 Tax=Clostridium sp. TaxID=1506 RepID=UPI003EE80CDF
MIEVKNLKKYFEVGKNKTLKAVDDISFYINKGETLGLVGESGCGKTTCGRTVIGLYEKTDGEIILNGKPLKNKKLKDRKEKSRIAQMIFQDPYASLNTRMTVGDIIAEGIDIHKLYKGKEREDRVYELLNLVGLNKSHAGRFPHEFSGGQRQRIGIARALAVEPQFIVCDEPISALDVSIQAQVVNLLIDLQRKLGLTYLFIAHDLSMVRHISDRVGVMYLGNLIEIAPSEGLYRNPRHPYSKLLMSAIPTMEDEKLEKVKIEGEVGNPMSEYKGCKFANRCEKCMRVCIETMPKLKEVEKNHFVACHLYD